jgi:hypothetical protein
LEFVSALPDILSKAQNDHTSAYRDLSMFYKIHAMRCNAIAIAIATVLVIVIHHRFYK